jgi:hypothetical protein
LDQQPASFETAASRPPQDEEQSLGRQSSGARLEGRTMSMQRLQGWLRCRWIAARRAEPTRWAPWIDARTVGAAGLRPAWSSAAGGRRLRRLPSKWASGNVTARSVRVPRRLRVGSRFRRGQSLVRRVAHPSVLCRRAASGPAALRRRVNALPIFLVLAVRETTTRASVRRLGPSRWAAWVAARRFGESSMTSDWLLQRNRQGRRPRGPVGKIRIDGWMQKEKGPGAAGARPHHIIFAF